MIIYSLLKQICRIKYPHSTHVHKADLTYSKIQSNILHIVIKFGLVLLVWSVLCVSRPCALPWNMSVVINVYEWLWRDLPVSLPRRFSYTVLLPLHLGVAERLLFPRTPASQEVVCNQREETTRVIITPKIWVLAILYHLCFDRYILIEQTDGPWNFPT